MVLVCLNCVSSLLNPTADKSSRRCCQRLGDQCVFAIRHIPTGNVAVSRL